MSEPTGVVLVLDNSFNVVKEYRGVLKLDEALGMIVLQSKDRAVFIPKTFTIELHEGDNDEFTH